jgi:putative ABC transport system ATP-binding protein
MSNAAAIASSTIAEATDLTKHFKSGGDTVRAVDGVSFALPRGKIIALRGPSGCGKSTLLNLLGALDRPDSGSLVVDGIDVSRINGRAEVSYRSGKVGFVFQQFNLVPHLTALENVALPLEFGSSKANDRQSHAHSLLDRVGLSREKHGRRPSRLSGGEQQRVAIARSLANGAPVLLADEPTANLDSRTGRLIIELLCSLPQENRTVIIATHDGGIAARADIVIEMNDGKIARVA